MIPAWWLGAAAVRMLPDWGLGPVEHLRRLVLLLSALFGGAVVILFLGKTGAETSRISLTTAYGLSLLLVPILRLWLKRTMLARGQWGVPVVIYGGEETLEHVIGAMRQEGGLGYHPIGIFSDGATENGPFDIPLLGTLDENTDSAPVAVVAARSLSRERLISMLDGPLAVYRRVIIIPDLFEAPSLWVTPRDFMGVLGLELMSNLLDPVARFVKRAFDMIFTIVTFPLWGVLGLLISLAIWLEDRHSPFFSQDRVGLGGRTFRTWKFRTMMPDAERILQEKISSDPNLELEWSSNFKLRDDPRITRTGSFLRKTSLDELPQLVNVLKGEMSLVGPRPLPQYHYERLPERVRRLRDRVRPGITGLWQVSGRSDSGTEGMSRWDSYYVRNWSLWLDIVILVRTLRAVLSGHGAY